MPRFKVEMTCSVMVEADDEAAASFAAYDPSHWEGEPFELDVLGVYPDEEEEE